MNYILTQRCSKDITKVHKGLGQYRFAHPRRSGAEYNRQGCSTYGIYQGRRRMTQTYPLINRAGKILWLVTGAEKSGKLQRLIEKDTSIPAGRVNQENAMVVDREAAGMKA